MNLTPERFQQARLFIQATARPLEQHLFATHFEGGPAEAVLEQLGRYQNSDGGFGHALEPDFRLPLSTPMATSVGLQVAADLDTPADHPLVSQGVGYLLDTYQHEGDFWQATRPEVNDYPHAPWWRVDELTAPDDDAWPNPSAELVGYLHRWSSLAPAAILERARQRLERVLDAGRSMSDAPGKSYNLLCWQRAADNLPPEVAGRVRQQIGAALEAMQPITAESLGEIRVAWLAPAPDALLNQVAPAVVGRLLDEEIQRQAADGGWWPAWAWGQYPQAWPQAQREWAGRITLETLRTLRRFGRA